MAELLGSGSFTVDRARALDKLIHFQLPDAQLFALPWLRCAAASGATRVDIRARTDRFELAFDGRPFAPDELKDPYQCLFEKARPDMIRRRELAVGILTALRLEPKGISVVSGSYGKDRFKLSLISPAHEELEASADGRSGTILTVSRRAVVSTLDKKLSESLFSLCRCSRMKVTVQGIGRGGEWPSGFVSGLSFDDGEIYGSLDVPAEPGGESALAACKFGLVAGNLRHALASVQVDGFINDDGFTLNASQSGVARNRRFTKTMLRAGEKAVELLLRTARGQAARLKEVAPLLQGGWGWFWSDRLERRWAAEVPHLFPPARWLMEPLRSSWTKLTDPVRYEKNVRSIRRAARETDWLREASLRHAGDLREDSPGELATALRQAPLLLDLDGAPLSLETLELQRRRIGRVPYAERRDRRTAPPMTVARLSSEKDLPFLKEHFKEDVFDITPSLAKNSRPGEEPSGPSLERAGITGILIRAPLQTPDWSGEVALTSEAGKAARLCVFNKGLPASFLEYPCGLRFEAAITRRRGALREIPEPENLRLILLQTAGLYERAAKEYPNEALLPHLLDFLAWTLAPGSGAGPEHQWIREAVLFNFIGRGLSYEGLLKDHLAGKNFYSAPAPEGSNNRQLLAGPSFTEEIIKKLLPDAASIAVPSNPRARLWFCRERAAPAEIPAELPVSAAEGLELMISILQNIGTALDDPGSPARRFLLKAALRYLCPWGNWPQPASARRFEHALELLRNLPFFRQASGKGPKTLEAVSQMLASSPPLIYRNPEGQGPDAHLVLSEEEAALVKAMWPAWRERLFKSGEAPPAPEVRNAAAWGGDTTSVVSPLTPTKAVSPTLVWAHPMLFLRRYLIRGMTVEFGLPMKYSEPKAGRRRGPGPFEEIDAVALRIVGRALVDASGLRDNPDPRPVLREAARRFFDEFLAQCGTASADSIDHRYLLELFLANSADSVAALEPGWPGLLKAIEEAPLLPSLGGRTSLATITAKAGAAGKLPLAPRPLPAAPPEDAWIPMIRQRWLVEMLKRAVAPLKITAYKLPPQAPPEPGADGPELARRLLRELSGLRGQKGELGAADPLAPALAGSILSAGLSHPEQAAYLASLAATGANRSARLLTDLDDGRFQQALARRLAVGEKR